LLARVYAKRREKGAGSAVVAEDLPLEQVRDLREDGRSYVGQPSSFLAADTPTRHFQFRLKLYMKACTPLLQLATRYSSAGSL
jgi:hypothetical protein